MVELASDILVQVYSAAIPVAVVFELGNIVVGMFMRAAFGGKLWLG